MPWVKYTILLMVVKRQGAFIELPDDVCYRGRLHAVLFVIRRAEIVDKIDSSGWNRRQSNRFQPVKLGAMPRRKSSNSVCEIIIWLL